jgi:hypothetical protein
MLVFWPHSVWTKSLVCKDAVNKDSTYQSIFRRLCSAKKIEEFKFPVSRPDDRAIPSGHPSVHCSIRSDDVPYRPDSRQTSIIRPDDMFFSFGPSTVSRSFCSSLHPSERLSSPSGRLKSLSGRLSSSSGRLSVIDQLQILSKFRIRED